jgi:hypothetical protein
MQQSSPSERRVFLPFSLILATVAVLNPFEIGILSFEGKRESRKSLIMEWWAIQDLNL